MHCIRDTHSLSGSMVIGRECREFPPTSERNSGGDSNSWECALWEPSGLGWAGPGVARALCMRICRGMAGGWLGGSVVGLGGSVCPVGAGPAEVPGGGSEWTLGGDGGIWAGGERRGSKLSWVAALVLSSLLSPLRTAEGTVTGTEPGSLVADSGPWLEGGSTAWRLVTGVVLFGGVGGERLACAGTTMTPLPGCESSAVDNDDNQSIKWPSLHAVINQAKSNIHIWPAIRAWDAYSICGGVKLALLNGKNKQDEQ